MREGWHVSRDHTACVPDQSKRLIIRSPVRDGFQLHRDCARRHNTSSGMSTFVAKVFVLTVAMAYAILLIALVIWIIRRKAGNDKGKDQR